MIKISTLEAVKCPELLQAFNQSFSDYQVPMQLGQEQLMRKIITEKIVPELSPGIFFNEELVGFILHGLHNINGVTTVYNAGTGMIPTHRGNHSTRAMYEFIMPMLKNAGVQCILLEVITENLAALRTYLQIGFKIKRGFWCFQGGIDLKSPDRAFQVREIEVCDWRPLKMLWQFSPSWQNSDFVLDRCPEENKCLAVFKQDVLAGYAIFCPQYKKLHQLAVKEDFRGQRVASTLMRYIAENVSPEVFITNVDDRAEDVIGFLLSVGLKKTVSQYEMELNI